MKHWLFSRNIIVLTFYRIFLVLLLLFLSRIGFYFFNAKMFPGIDTGEFFSILRGGLVFDISAAVYINMLFILMSIIPLDLRYNAVYQKISAYVFYFSNGLALALNSADYVYYRFVLKRATADVFGTFENESHMPKMFLKFLIDYWPATLFCLTLWFLMVLLYKKIPAVKPDVKKKLQYHLINLLFVPLAIALVIGAARGGYRHSTRPITISNAAKYVERPENVALVLNTPFSILRTSGKKSLARYEFYPEEILDSLYNPHHVPSDTGKFRSENVVIIILESFAREYIGSFNRHLQGGTYTGYTPFIDSLLNVSLTFDVSLGNGRKSIDAMPSILASIPSLETPYIISHYANNRIEGLAYLLKKKGYYTTFFHGAPNGSMGFDSFATMSGFDNYVGLNEYPNSNDFDGMWGVWDEPFLRFFAEKIKTFPQPFLASVFTISSHHPFEVPLQYRNKFKKGPAPIVEVVGYTDYALKEFFKKAAAEPWFDNTIFVITADHTNESFHKEYQNNFGSYSIPIIFYKPGNSLSGIKDRIAQQIDIMPSILSYLGFDEEYIAFGNNLFDDSYESFAFNTNGNIYHLYMMDHLLEMIDNKAFGLYNYKNDIFLERNLIEENTELVSRMEQKLKAIIQVYNSRLLDNEMTVKK
jgi:phosphoglycerol transferase MdoB-like AlkP superfamily enzyme